MPMMRSFLLGAVCCALCLPLSSAERREQQPPSPAEERTALAFLEAKGVARLLDRNVEEMIRQQCAAAPETAAFRAVLERVYREYFGFAALKEDLVRYYLAKFSAAELEELTRFYNSPAGRRLVASELDLVPETARLMIRQSKAMLPKLQKELKAAGSGK